MNITTDNRGSWFISPNSIAYNTELDAVRAAFGSDNVVYRLVDSNEKPCFYTVYARELVDHWKGAPEGIEMQALFEGFDEWASLRYEDMTEYLQRRGL